MDKVSFGKQMAAYPMPVVLVGTIVNGKPNFMAVAWFSKVNSDPPMMMVALGKQQYTGEGVRENGYFSVNLPDRNHVSEIDYCGLVSGREEDKARLFKVFYGDPRNAPMIKECPVNFDLKLKKTVELDDTILYIGEVIGAYIDPGKLSSNIPDLRLVEPFMLVEGPSNYYCELGQWVAEAFKVGDKLRLKR